MQSILKPQSTGLIIMLLTRFTPCTCCERWCCETSYHLLDQPQRLSLDGRATVILFGLLICLWPAMLTYERTATILAPVPTVFVSTQQIETSNDCSVVAPAAPALNTSAIVLADGTAAAALASTCTLSTCFPARLADERICSLTACAREWPSAALFHTAFIFLGSRM